MDNGNEIKEGLDEKSAGGYVKVIVWILITGIVFLAGQFIYLNNLKAKELAALNLYHINRTDSLRRSDRELYQAVVDREREGHIKQIEKLNNRVDQIQDNSDINGKLAKENALASQKNRKIVINSYLKIKNNEKR